MSKKMKTIKSHETKSFLLGMTFSACLFLAFHCYQEREAFFRCLRCWAGTRRRKCEKRQRGACYCQCQSYSKSQDLEAFLKTYQPEIFATLMSLLKMAEISLEDYFDALEAGECWSEFQQFMGDVSLMVMEQSQLSEESELLEVRERYIPKLLTAMKKLKATL